MMRKHFYECGLCLLFAVLMICAGTAFADAEPELILVSEGGYRFAAEAFICDSDQIREIYNTDSSWKMNDTYHCCMLLLKNLDRLVLNRPGFNSSGSKGYFHFVQLMDPSGQTYMPFEFRSYGQYARLLYYVEADYDRTDWQLIYEDQAYSVAHLSQARGMMMPFSWEDGDLFVAGKRCSARMITAEESVIRDSVKNVPDDAKLMVQLYFDIGVDKDALMSAVRDLLLVLPDGGEAEPSAVFPVETNGEIHDVQVLYQVDEPGQLWNCRLRCAEGDAAMLIPWLNGLRRELQLNGGGDIPQNYDGKWLVVLWKSRDDWNPDVSLPGRSTAFDALPAECLAASPEEVGRIVLIYPEHGFTGNYDNIYASNTVRAYSTRTVIGLYQNSGGFWYESRSAAFHSAPKAVQVSIMNGEAKPDAFYGEYDYDAAIEYLAGRPE